MPPHNEDGLNEVGEDEGGGATEGDEDGVHEDQNPQKIDSAFVSQRLIAGPMMSARYA